jgi:uncharacterized Zn-binding protein involved in type VI secretion
VKTTHRFIALGAAALLIAGCGSSSGGSSTSANAAGSSTTSSVSQTSGQHQVGFEGVPIEQGGDLASPGTTGTAKVDGIQCGATEQLAYHIHAHLMFYVNGHPRALPGGIGIPGSQVVASNEGPVASGGQCIYWLHTHAPDGVIHIESPTRRIYSLGNFFDVWHQPLSGSQVATAKGPVTVFVNGKPWTKDPRAIPLNPHTVIQISVGSPVVPFHGMSWSGLQL